MAIDSEPIKACAKGTKGTELLTYYGEETKKTKLGYVPYIRVNGIIYDGYNFLGMIARLSQNHHHPAISLNVETINTKFN